MKNPFEIWQDLQEKTEKIIENSPMKDAQEHFKTWMNQNLQKLNLVTREEFDIQAKVLERTREKLEQLEQKWQTQNDTHTQTSTTNKPSQESNM